MLTATHAEAIEAYIAAHVAAIGLVADIDEAIANLPAPGDETHWGHVGDLNRIVKLLEAVKESLPK